MASLAITGDVFRWARERAGLSDERLAMSLHIKPEKIRAWETGQEYPNFHQAQKIASALYIPLGYLFLSRPPEISIPIADFRTLPGKQKKELSINLQDILDDALRKRDWYREWRISEDQTPFDFIGKFTVQSLPEQIVLDIRKIVEIPLNFTSRMRTWDEHLRLFIQKIESVGILVLQSGIVGNNTRRNLSIEEFRGFALADQYAPLIFINAKDAIAGRIFTLAHELIHLWTGTSGISNPVIIPNDDDIFQIEQLCNRCAAELLVPSEAFFLQWDKHLDTLENTQRLVRYFRVSAQVILRRSFDLGIIPADEYYLAFQKVLSVTKPVTTRGGGNFYNNFFSRNSRRFTTELFSAVNSGNISYLDAARLLNTQPGKIVIAMEKLK